MAKQKSLLRGVLAGAAGGLAAAWIMNEFMTGLGPAVQQAVASDEEKRESQTHSNEQSQEPREDATMKAADAVTHAATGEHLTREQKEKGGPVVHYAFGALAGGIYGGLAEYSPAARSGFGTSFGGVLFSAADFLAVPAFGLGPWPSDQPASAQATPFAAHIVYGVTTELVRRIVRLVL